jgi:nucleoside-diphosphate-sugar epimerase
VRAAARNPATAQRVSARGGSAIAIGELGESTDWSAALIDIDVVVHLAARVNQMGEIGSDSLAAHRRTNVLGTARLAAAAAEAGVRRLVFVSTVKVNGEGQPLPYRESDPPMPSDAYAISKWEAEEALRDDVRLHLGRVVILRPPLVYGPGVRANFLRLVRLVARHIPLPFGTVENRRSLIYVGNLADAVVRCVAAQTAGSTYLVSDGDDVSTPELVRRIAAALGVRPALVPFPPRALQMAAAFARRPGAAHRLLSSCFVDTERIRRELGWAPPFSMATGLEETARWYRAAS